MNQKYSEKNMKKEWRKKWTDVFHWGKTATVNINTYFYTLVLGSKKQWKAWSSKIFRSKKLTPVHLDDKRRAFLKYALFGGGLFLVGKYMNPIINTIQGDAVVDEKVFRNFTLTETGRQLQVTDDEGNEILTIDKEGF